MKPDKDLVKEWFKELGFESIHEMTKPRFNKLMKLSYENGFEAAQLLEKIFKEKK
jgi:N-acetylglutamate synthase-like GNAT family acetyltransferase